MKIVFDSEAEKEKVLKKLAGGLGCPSDMLLKNSCRDGGGDCGECWKAALEAIEKKEG